MKIEETTPPIKKTITIELSDDEIVMVTDLLHVSHLAGYRYGKWFVKPDARAFYDKLRRDLNEHDRSATVSLSFTAGTEQ